MKAALDLTKLTKHIFDYSQQDTTNDSNGLAELIVDNFDDEQIWQEIELHNDPCLKHSFQAVAKLIAGKEKGNFFAKSKSRTSEVKPLDESDEEHDDGDHDEEEQENLEYSSSQDLFPEMQTEEADGDGEHESDDEDETNFDINGLASKRTRAKMINMSSISNKSKMRTSVVDDKFFKLSEMERFLELEDAREERRRDEEEGKGRRDRDYDAEEEEDEDDDDESIDYFQELPSDDEDYDEEEDEDEDNQVGKVSVKCGLKWFTL